MQCGRQTIHDRQPRSLNSNEGIILVLTHEQQRLKKNPNEQQSSVNLKPRAYCLWQLGLVPKRNKLMGKPKFLASRWIISPDTFCKLWSFLVVTFPPFPSQSSRPRLRVFSCVVYSRVRCYRRVSLQIAWRVFLVPAANVQKWPRYYKCNNKPKKVPQFVKVEMFCSKLKQFYLGRIDNGEHIVAL